jgi:hypothetical protein
MLQSFFIRPFVVENYVSKVMGLIKEQAWLAFFKYILLTGHLFKNSW